jgi:N-acetylglucosaminyl-diphospho-decaprenol L-rhamnosyltransferase
VGLAAVAMDLSVVVVNYRTPELAARAMADARAACGGLDVEEILVDNGSGDGAALRAGRPGATVLELGENRGFGAGVNAGLAAARGRHVLLVNSDAFCRGDAAAELVAHLDAHPRAGIAAPKVLNPDGSQQLNAYRRFPSALTVFLDYCFPLSAALYGGPLHPYVVPRARYDRPRAVAHVMGAALAVRREAAEQAGPFDERFFLYLEETEWQRRVAAAGWEIDLVPGAEVTHLGGASTGDYSFASEPFLASLERYHHGRPAVRRAAMAGAAISLATARVAQRLRPADPRFPALGDACRRALAGLRRSRWA